MSSRIRREALARQSIRDGYFNYEVISAERNFIEHDAWEMLHAFHGEPIFDASDLTLSNFYKFLALAMDIDESSINDSILIKPQDSEAKIIEDDWILALKEFECILSDIPLFERTYRVCTEAIRLNAKDFCYVPEALRTEKLCLLAMKKEPSVLFFLPDQLITRELCKLAVSRDAQLIHRVPERHLKRDVWLAAAERDGLILRDCPPQAITSEIALAAVRSNGGAIAYIPPHSLTPRLCEAAINAPHAASLQAIPPHLRTERIILQAVENDPMMLGQIPIDEQSDNIRLAAVKRDGKAIQFIPKDEQTKLICFHALLDTLECHPWVSEKYIYESIVLLQQIRPDSRFPKSHAEAVRRIVQNKCPTGELLAKSYLSQFPASEVVPLVGDSVKNAKALSGIYEERVLAVLFQNVRARGAMFEQTLGL